MDDGDQSSLKKGQPIYSVLCFWCMNFHSFHWISDQEYQLVQLDSCLCLVVVRWRKPCSLIADLLVLQYWNLKPARCLVQITSQLFVT